MRKPKSEWTDLFLAFRMTLDPRKLWLAFRGLILSVIVVGLLLFVLASLYYARGVRFVRVPAPTSSGRGLAMTTQRVLAKNLAVKAEPEQTNVLAAVWELRLGDAIRATARFVRRLTEAAKGELDEQFPKGVRPRALPLLAVSTFWRCESVGDLAIVGLLVAFVLLLIWSYYGAAIMRIASVEYALGERIAMASAAAYAWRKHHCYYGGPLGIAAAIVILGLGIFLGGLIGWNVVVIVLAIVGLLAAGVAGSMMRDRVGRAWAGLVVGGAVLIAFAIACALVGRHRSPVPYVGEAILGVLSPLAFLGGFVMALLGVWLAFGVPLMAGTVSAQDTDTFHAWSQSFHYLFVHPWRYAFYLLVSLAYGIVCLGFVFVVRLLTEWATLMPLSIGLMGRFTAIHPFMDVSQVAGAGTGSDRVLAFFLSADRFILDLVFLSFAVAYMGAAATITYFLMRKCSDGTPISEVHLEPRDRELIEPAPASEPAPEPEVQPEPAPESEPQPRPAPEPESESQPEQS